MLPVHTAIVLAQEQEERVDEKNFHLVPERRLISNETCWRPPEEDPTLAMNDPYIQMLASTTMTLEWDPPGRVFPVTCAIRQHQNLEGRSLLGFGDQTNKNPSSTGP